MIIYNVTIKVSPEINLDWLIWMKEIHIPGILDTGLFHDYRMSRLLEQDDTDGPTYTVQYYTDSYENYQTYLQEYAAKFRELSFDMWGDNFVAFRTVMQVV
ncbi:hypothetical protein COR50_05955 [Chitinophaga caeni]|uniref:DUF4286 domain-containing protein n=1 Tax=Chitinophaga caeni TaxID=2029983 RepID=A0A291QS88_9BACT|nr:DUF4286 family protein [Chitinophaga caeni]ATL46753.1 hypothetical protein COR50_05955 [Chitinophaga caeni]